jgi:hypothetical protein
MQKTCPYVSTDDDDSDEDAEWPCCNGKFSEDEKGTNGLGALSVLCGVMKTAQAHLAAVTVLHLSVIFA